MDDLEMAVNIAGIEKTDFLELTYIEV